MSCMGRRDGFFAGFRWSLLCRRDGVLRGEKCFLATDMALRTHMCLQESFQWLMEEPDDASVKLLAQIAGKPL